MRRVVGLVLVVLLPMVVWAQDAGRRPDLESLFEDQALKLTEPGAVMWLPDGEHIIYTLKREGGFDLWRESVTTGERSRVVDWSAMLAALRAERPDFERPVMADPNAASGQRNRASLSPDGRLLVGCVAGELFSLHLESGTARLLTDEPGQEIFPTFSPDGTRIAFVRNGDLFSIRVDNGSTQRLTDRGDLENLMHGVADWVYEEEFAVDRAFWWSPDSARIAFLQFDVAPVPIVPILDSSGEYPMIEQQRYPKAGSSNPVVQVGVVDLATQGVRWLLAAERDWYVPRAGWTPAGQVWAQRLNRNQNELQLVSVDPQTDELRMLLLETDAAWINITDDLVFLDDGRFLWTSERSGWRHLELRAASGRLIRQLTSGEFEVDRVYGVTADETRAWVRTNRANRRQRHVEVVNLATSEIREVDRGEGGVHDALLSPRKNLAVDAWSSLDKPPRADLLSLDRGVVRELWNVDSQLAGWDLLPFERATVQADDGVELDALLLKPRGFDVGAAYPVVLYMYGGPHSQITRDRWGDSIHHTWRVFAENGMAVFAVDNRGTAGRGRTFERAVHRQLGRLEVGDQLAAVRWLKARPWVDDDRIAAYGGSYGGYLVLMCLMSAPEELAAGIAYAPVTDWRFYDTVYTERYMDQPANNPEGYRRGAPLELADRLKRPVLIVHGMMDNNVHVQNTLQLVGKLAEAGAPFELMIYPQTRHGVRRSKTFAAHFHRLKLDFLLRHLKGE